jgi:ureidoglycolate hydrolase
MKSAAEDAESSYSQLSTIQLQIAQSQPVASPDMLQLLERAIARTQARIPALERSIEEVKMEYNLP